jgi:hypothetical protein
MTTRKEQMSTHRLVLHQHPFASFCQKRSLRSMLDQPFETQLLMHRPSVARVIDEARPYRGVFPLPWPADVG